MLSSEDAVISVSYDKFIQMQQQQQQKNLSQDKSSKKRNLPRQRVGEARKEL